MNPPMAFLYQLIEVKLKPVLLHNGGFYASIRVGHSVLLEEIYENSEVILQKLKYYIQN